MADPVYIDGFSQDAISQLPDWASEATLGKILKSIQTSSKMQNASFQKLEAALRNFTGKTSDTTGPTINPKLIGQVNDELRDSLKFAADEAKQNTKTKKQWQSQNKQSTIGDALFGKMSKSATAFNSVLVGIDIVAAAGIKAIKENVEGYSNLYKAGVGVVDSTNSISDGFMSLQHIVLLSGIRLTDLMAVTAKYANTVTVYGTQKFIKASVLAQKSLQNLGYSAVEGLEFTASYLDSVKGFTDTANISADTMANSAVKFGTSMRSMSLLTGQSTIELMSKFKDLAKTTDASILSTRFGTKATASMTGFLAGLKDQNLAKSLQDLMVAPIKQVDETVNALLASGKGALAQGLMDVTSRITAASKLGASPEEQAEIFRQFASSVKVSDAEKQNLQLQALGGNLQARKSLDIIASLEHSARDISQLTPGKLSEIKKETEAMNARNKIADKWNSISARFNAMFTLNTSTLEWFGSVLDNVAEGMDWFSKKFEGSIIPGISAIGVLVASTLFSFKSIFSLGSWLTRKILGIKVPELPNPIKPGLMSRVGETITSSASKTVTYISEAFSSITSKIGPLFSRIITGLEAGLSSAASWFSNMGSRLWTPIAAMFKTSFGGILETITSFAARILPAIGTPLSLLGKMFAGLLGRIGLLYSAFEVGQAVGDQLHALVKDFSWFQDGMDSLFSWLDRLLQFIPGQIGKDAKARIETQKEIETKGYLGPATTAAISTTKIERGITEPARTVVQSVSAAPAPALKSETADVKSKTVNDTESLAKAAPVAKEPEINTILKYQTSLLEQLLDKNVDMLTSQREMARISRNS